MPLGAAPVLVNKAEVAGILGISLPTLAAWIARYSDFPVYERGANGREWRFDAAAVRAWELSRREAEARDEAARRDLLAQFALPLTDPGDAATGMASPPSKKSAASAKATNSGSSAASWSTCHPSASSSPPPSPNGTAPRTPPCARQPAI